MSETQFAEHQVPSFASANFNPEVGREQREKKERPKLSTRDEAGRPRSPINGALVPKGRAKGTPNKVTQTLREAVELAARDCHPQGLAGWLVERAQGGVQDRQIFWIADATGAEPAAQGLQATQHGSGHQGSQGPANAAPEPVKTLSRASGGQADPPPPVDPDMGGVSRSRGPLPPSSTPKKPFCAALTTNQPAEP